VIVQHSLDDYIDGTMTGMGEMLPIADLIQGQKTSRKKKTKAEVLKPLLFINFHKNWSGIPDPESGIWKFFSGIPNFRNMIQNPGKVPESKADFSGNVWRLSHFELLLSLIDIGFVWMAHANKTFKKYYVISKFADVNCMHCHCPSDLYDVVHLVEARLIVRDKDQGHWRAR
jgi:hypothetical protein